MRVFCPTCQEPVTIGDDLAGKATFCPLCKAAFTAPTLFSSAPPTAAPPPSVPLPTPPPSPAPAPDAIAPEPRTSPAPIPAPTPVPKPMPSVPAPAPAPAPMPSPTPGVPGQTRGVSLSISPEIVQWAAPVCLVLVFILTMFSWNGAYPGGHSVYTQSPWGALFGNFYTDPVGDEIFDLNPSKPKTDNQWLLRNEVHSNFLMLPYLAIVLIGAPVAVAAVAWPQLREKLNLKIPAQAEKFIQYRIAAVAVLALLGFLILGFQSLMGFSLESTIRNRIESEMVKEREKAEKPDQKKALEIKRGMAENGLVLQKTTAHCLALWAHLVGALTASMTFVMNRRTAKPHPRIEVVW